MLMEANLERIWSRWKVSIERYGWSVENLPEETDETQLAKGIAKMSAYGRAIAVYGETDLVGRILLFVLSPHVVRSCYEEVLETCVEEICPKTATELRRDMLALEQLLKFEDLSGRLLASQNSSKRYG